MNKRRKLALTGITLMTLCSTGVWAQEWEGEARDAWIDGKLEGSYLLNSELNNFEINTAVDSGVVTLSGTVDSAIHKDLAEEIAVNLEGVQSVNNQLTIGESDYDMDESGRRFTTVFHDMTTTASIKSNFALNPQLEALEINIDTKEGVVSLEGEVESVEAKELAEEIASGFDYVTQVDNRLQVVANP